jgi:hypothetical protein
MLSDEFKQRIGCILGLEEHGDDADWFAIATLSAEILTELPESAPLAVRAYLTDFDIRRVSPALSQTPAKGHRSIPKIVRPEEWFAPELGAV